jgi:hypothetical protein
MSMIFTQNGLIICVQWKFFLHHLNSQCADTKFTIEIEKEGYLAFLDVLVKKVDDTLKTSVYRKPTDSELYLQYTSNHAKTIKNRIVNTLLHRADTICSDIKEKENEYKKVEEILLKNGYPGALINNIKNKRKRKQENPCLPPLAQEEKKDEKKKREALVALPYTPTWRKNKKDWKQIRRQSCFLV